MPELSKNVAGSAATTTDRGAGLEGSSALEQFGLLQKESQIPMLHGFVLWVNAGYRAETR
jgi:hypothetical protein